MRLKDKVAFISGGARGLGAAQARLFVEHGAKVVVADIRDEEGKAFASELAASGESLYAHLDVTSEGDWNAAIAATVERFGRLDVLVNNAGIYQRATVEETTAEDWDRMMAINGKGVFLGTKAAIPAMRKSGGGSIINISSVAGLIGGPISTAYNASKGAVRLLTKSTAIQYAKDGIRANSVHPGLTRTDMMDLVFPDANDAEIRKADVPLGRHGTPEDVAYAVLYLASDESSYMTGSELVIDGGWTAK
jgi:NAD(P)-dependent dehydrogenase (short-subunit alcohol dehydrogenase family)